MNAFVLFVEKIVMAAMKLARVLKFKTDDENEEVIMGIIDSAFETIFG